jgi:SAM-dependent methyltransferase
VASSEVPGAFSTQLLPLLRCPDCRSAFAFEAVSCPEAGGGEFGTLRCACAVYPVVDDIPIIQRAPVGMFEHTRGTVQSVGTSIETLVGLIRSGQALEALLECVVAAPQPGRFLQTCLGWRRSRAFERKLAQHAFRREVLGHRRTSGALEVLEYYYLRGGPLDAAMGHYFICRFGMPRHLAALSLAARIPHDTRPVLDIACGIGSLAHYFTNRQDAIPVVGLDMNFYHLWIARHWVAPAGHYVCANAGEPLPFTDAAFSAVLCSDAYHLLPNRVALLHEIERTAPGRPVVVTRVGNREVMPNEGAEQDVEGYATEFGSDSIDAFDEDELVRHYLDHSNPFADRKDRPRLARSKWLSFAWNIAEPLRTGNSVDAIPPHAVGTIGWNPIYRRSRLPEGDLRLHFEFPAIWYAYENHRMLAYHPRRITVPAARVARMADWQSDPELRGLVDSFVLVGLPERFTTAHSSHAT